MFPINSMLINFVLTMITRLKLPPTEALQFRRCWTRQRQCRRRDVSESSTWDTLSNVIFESKYTEDFSFAISS